MEERRLTPEEKVELLKIARMAVSSALEGKKFKAATTLEGLLQERGAFVTIHKNGALRGCIGTFFSNEPLFKTVESMAESAAFRDPRFSPVSKDEFQHIDLEISVLSPLREIADINKIEVGKHGIYVSKGHFRGVLLPQVATEYGWDRETFLSHTCQKAGLPLDEWKRGVKIEVFSAQIFGEKELEQ